MDCADCTISLDTSLAKLARVIDIGMSLTLLAKRLKPTKCWYTTALVIASAEYAISLDTLLAKRLIPTKCWYTTARVIASAEYAISLDTLLAKRLKPTKCWHTTARVIADGLRWLHYLTRHTVSQAIDTYEVLIHNRKGDSQCWIRYLTRHTVSQAIDTYEVLTHNRKGDSQCWIRNLTRHFVSQACKGDWYWNGLTLLAKWLIPTKCWHTTARVIAWTALIALSHSTHC